MNHPMARSLRLSSCATAFALIAASSTAWAQKAPPADDTKIVPLMNKAFSDIRGKEGTMLTVEYAPGASSPRHRHDAHVFVYVLEGSIVMQAEGKPAVTLKPGDTFYEDPKDVHAVSKNASTTQSAKFVVFMVKKKGVAPVLPAK
jgi:quercetin dioxygenase-like cupin family protein